MAKLVLKPEPTFSATVAIPIPGGTTADVRFTFNHMRREALAAFIEELDKGEMLKVPAIMKVATGWDLDDEFNEASVIELTECYLGSARVILDTFIQELTQAKAKNS